MQMWGGQKDLLNLETKHDQFETVHKCVTSENGYYLLVYMCTCSMCVCVSTPVSKAVASPNSLSVGCSSHAGDAGERYESRTLDSRTCRPF